MLTHGLTIASALILALTAYLAIRSIKVFREAKLTARKVNWARAELDRALKLIDSDDENEIVTGLQILSMFNDPAIRMRAFARLAQLSQDDRPYIRSQAAAAISRVTSQESRSRLERRASAPARN